MKISVDDFGTQLEGAVLGVSDKGTSTVLVADVHTESNTHQVLEEEVGFADLILVAYRVPDGRILMGAGPVFTYSPIFIQINNVPVTHNYNHGESISMHNH